MSNYNSLKATINANIKTNGNQEITGSVLNSVLTAMVNTLGVGYKYVGIATPSTNPGSPDANVFYIATNPGTYTHFGNLVVSSGEVAIFKFNGTWTKDVTGFATSDQLYQLNIVLQQLYNDINGDTIIRSVTIGSGGTMTFSPIELSQNGDAIEVKATYTIGNTNEAYAFSRFNGGIALSLNQNVIGLKDSAGAWVNEMNAGAGRYASPLVVNSGRKFKLVYENGQMNLYVSDLDGVYPSTPALSVNSQPNVKIDTLCGVHNGYYWTGQIFEFNYTHNGVTLPYHKFQNFAYSGNVVFQTEQTGGIKGQIEAIENRMEDFLTEDDIEKENPLEEKYVLPKVLTGKLVNSDTGDLVDASGYPYIVMDIRGLNYRTIRTKISAFGANRGYGFVLDNGTWVGTHTTTTGETTIQVPDNAVTFKFCWNPSLVPVSTQYFYFGKNISLQESYEESKHNNIFFPFLPKFDLSEIPQTSFIQDTSDLSDVYGRYDALMASYPQYITRIDCSSADSIIGVSRPSQLSGMPIYIYKFRPILARVEDYDVIPRAFIITGLHSNEKMGIYTTYALMRMICENWNTLQDARLLRTKAEIYVLPILNPWGFVNAGSPVGSVELPGRQNYNGVNLNRNFPTENWVLSETGLNYSGPTPGSEYETKIAMYYANLIKPDFFLDAHTGNMNVYGAMGAIETMGTEELMGLSYAIARESTSRLMIDDQSFGGNADQPLYDVNKYSAFGEAAQWAGENICKLAFLTEQCVENKWLNGVLTNVVQSINTDTIFRENMQFTYNMLLNCLFEASVQKSLR